MVIVQKYGGTSLGDAKRIQAAAGRIAELSRQGHDLVVVVSAQGKTTDVLTETALQIHPSPSGREMDAYLSAGEQMSAALMAMALQSQGCDAVSLGGWQAGILTDSVHTNALIQAVEVTRIRKELKKGRIVVVTGFQGIDSEGDITTLGRGGSDTTAVALAAWLKADRCQIFTDVDGVYDKDPRIFPDALRFDRIGYGQMLALIRQGAQVLHDRSVLLARDQGIRMEVLSAFADSPGTVVEDSDSV